MPTRPARETYRHGNVRAEATSAAYRLVSAEGHEALSLRRVADAVGIAHRSLYNHFEDREALLDAVAEQGFTELAAELARAEHRDGYIRAYVTFARTRPRLYALMASRPHDTMKFKPALQRAVHLSIDEARRFFTHPGQSPEEARRSLMKVMILLRGAIAMHSEGILDVDGDEGLIAELQAMVAQG